MRSQQYVCLRKATNLKAWGSTTLCWICDLAYLDYLNRDSSWKPPMWSLTHLVVLPPNSGGRSSSKKLRNSSIVTLSKTMGSPSLDPSAADLDHGRLNIWSKWRDFLVSWYFGILNSRSSTFENRLSASNHIITSVQQIWRIDYLEHNKLPIQEKSIISLRLGVCELGLRWGSI